MSRLVVRRLEKDSANLETATAVQQMLFRDYLRALPANKARELADPNDGEGRLRKWQAFNGEYVGLYEGYDSDEMVGVVAIGTWRYGDELTRTAQLAARGREAITTKDRYPVGLHAFATIQEGLARAALRAIYTATDLVSPDRSVRAAVLSGDDGLRDAFIDLGGKRHERGTYQALGVRAVVCSLPPLNANHQA